MLNKSNYYTLNSLTLFWLAKSLQCMNFQNECTWRHNCRLYYYHVKDTQGHGLHIIYECKAWFPRVIMPTSHDSCCVPSVKKQFEVLLSLNHESSTRMHVCSKCLSCTSANVHQLFTLWHCSSTRYISMADWLHVRTHAKINVWSHVWSQVWF